MFNKRWPFYVFLACNAAPALAAVDEYTIDPNHTYPSIEFSHMGLSVWRGKFNRSTGRITIDRAANSGTVEVVIETASINFGLDAMDEKARSDDFFDVAGLEVRVLGRERSGVTEVWTGALRCLRDRHVRFLPAGGGNAVPEAEALVETRIRPFSVERVYRIGGARVVERLAPEAASPSAVFAWRVESGSIAGLEIEAEFDHRLFWPMREGAAGALRHAWSARANAFGVR